MGKKFNPKKAKFDDGWVVREFCKYIVFELTGDFEPNENSLKNGSKYAEVLYRDLLNARMYKFFTVAGPDGRFTEDFVDFINANYEKPHKKKLWQIMHRYTVFKMPEWMAETNDEHMPR